MFLGCQSASHQESFISFQPLQGLVSSLKLTTTGVEAAAKKWRGLINIHDLMFRIFERVD